MALTPRSKMLSVDLAVLMLGLLVMAQHSMQLSLKNPVVEGSNCNVNDLSKLGLVFASDAEETLLLQSGLFAPDADNPFVDIAGRRYHRGFLNGHLIVYVKTGYYSVNAAAAVQSLVQYFPIRGIVHFGTAGSLNETLLRPGDVSAAESFSFTGAWEWLKFGSNGGELIFGEYNYPENGENSLGSVKFDTVPLYTSEGVREDPYLPVTSNWLEVAPKGLADLPLERCYARLFCLPYKPEVVFNLKGSTSDIYLKNTAYGEFLHKTFDLSSADQESAAVALVALSNEKPFIVFRGISNSITSTSRPGVDYLATVNAFLAAARFIELLPSPRVACA